MKKICIISVCIFCALTTMAQTTTPKKQKAVAKDSLTKKSVAGKKNADTLTGGFFVKKINPSSKSQKTSHSASSNQNGFLPQPGTEKSSFSGENTQKKKNKAKGSR